MDKKHLLHVGIVARFSSYSHLKNALCLARALQEKNIKVSFFTTPYAEARVKENEFNIHKIGEGILPNLQEEPKKWQQDRRFLLQLRRFYSYINLESHVFFQELPPLLKQEQVNFIIADANVYSISTIAEHLNLPFVTLMTSLPTHNDPARPSYNSTRLYQRSWISSMRNYLDYLILFCIRYPVVKMLNQQRRKWHLTPFKKYEDNFSSLRQYVLCPREFEFNFTTDKLKQCIFVGNFDTNRTEEQNDNVFSINQLNPNKKLIYMSLGTIFQDSGIFEKVANVCAKLGNVQLVIGLGGTQTIDPHKKYPGDCILVPFAPQTSLLKRASLFITHAGMNSIREAISAQVPLIAIPMFYDQRGNAARVAYHKIGIQMSEDELTEDKLMDAITKTLMNSEFLTNLKKMHASAQKEGGVLRIVNDIVGLAAKYNLTIS